MITHNRHKNLFFTDSVECSASTSHTTSQRFFTCCCVMSGMSQTLYLHSHRALQVRGTSLLTFTENFTFLRYLSQMRSLDSHLISHLLHLAPSV